MVTDSGTKPDRRSTLLAAGRAILAEKGFEATTISEIVARAGVAQGTFYLYFPSKAALVSALNQEMDSQLLAAVREATAHRATVVDVIKAGISTAFEQLEHYRDILYILHSHTMLDYETTAKQHSAYHRLIADLILERQATGEIDGSINPTITAKLIAGLIDTVAEECFIYHQDAQSEPYIREVIHFVRRALILY